MHSSISTKLIARAAITMAMTLDRAESRELKQKLLDEHQISAAAVDFGGEFISSVGKIIERAVVASKREGLITDEYHLEGAVAGSDPRSHRQDHRQGYRAQCGWQDRNRPHRG